MDSLKVLDPDGPIREADSSRTSRHVRFVPIPDSCTAAKRHSITWVARASTACGISRPSALAVLRLRGKNGHAKTNSLLTMFVFDWTQHLAGPNRKCS